jgi:hypothetical protein
VTKEQLLDLLREAREYVESAADDGISPGEGWAILASIDAALAGRAEGSTENAVEWTTDDFGFNYVKQGNVLLQVVETIDGRWAWGMRVEGYATTEAEARRAAIAAAKGME